VSRKRRILLKISGGALGPAGGLGIGEQETGRIAREIVAAMQEGGQELALVVGGGNFLRGRDISSQRIGRVTADHMGMLATIINGLALQSVLESLNLETRVLSAFAINEMVEPFIRRKAIHHLEEGRVLILVGGTGLPYFSTDSTAAIRALELNAEILLKGTSVRGVYSADPKLDPNAELFHEISFDAVLQKSLKVIDATAISLCRDQKLPVEIFDMTVEGNIQRAIRGERLGTLIRS
jgi:uridylate kinase